MVVCKFFLQGNCRYGENCRFQHQVNDSAFQQNYTSILRQQNFTGNTNTGNTGGTTKNVDLNMLIQSVTTDMLSAEKGGQWLLSSYAPFKEKANYQGFEDRSFEEVRFGYYTARNTGSLDQFLQQLQIAQQQAASIIRSLQNPSQEAIATISNIYNSIPASSNTFGAKSTNSIFGQTTQQQNQGLFVQNQQQANQTSPMKSSNNIFGQANHQNQGLFAQNQQPVNPASSIFGGNGGAPSKIFGGGVQQNPIFGGGVAVQAGNAVQPPFGNVQQSNAFAQPLPTQNQPSSFSFLGSYQTANNQANVPPAPLNQFAPPQGAPSFPTPTQNNPPSIFGAQPSSQPTGGINFGLQPTTPSIVPNVASQNNVQMQPNIQASSQNLFINNSKPTNSIFGNQNKPPPEMEEDIRTYSKLEDLSENDIKNFQSAEFEFGKIPEKPPTREMCF